VEDYVGSLTNKEGPTGMTRHCSEERGMSVQNKGCSGTFFT
jgi:hypothetical protein